MNTDNPNNRIGTGWQVLGELELSAGAGVEDTLYAWLTKMLHPLNLQAELLSKILISAQDALSRALHAGVMLRFEHVHVIVFMPIERQTKMKAWSFFRVEKIEDPKTEQMNGDHAVELYLYAEGD